VAKWPKALGWTLERMIRLANLRPSGHCPSPKARRPHKSSTCGAYVFLVAGAGFEPATFGL